MTDTPPENESEIRVYRINADYKKCTYQTEQWNNTLQNGKPVRFEVTTYFRWGTFEIELNEQEKEEILNLDSVVLNDWGCSCIELTNGCDQYEQIVNEDNFDDDEKKEIHKLLYHNKEGNEEYDKDADYCVDEDVLQMNGWSMDDTIYGFSTGCELEDITLDDSNDSIKTT